MPASEIFPKFRAHELHSGSPNGPIVTNEHQARAILLGYLRREGKIPDRIAPGVKRRKGVRK